MQKALSGKWNFKTNICIRIIKLLENMLKLILIIIINKILCIININNNIKYLIYIRKYIKYLILFIIFNNI